MSLAFVLIAALGGEAPDAELYLRGHVAQQGAKYGDAHQAFEKCAQMAGPLAGYASVRTALCRARGGDPEGAIEALQGVIGKETGGPWVRMARAELAMLLKEQDRHAEAAPHFQAALDCRLAPRWMRRFEWASATSHVQSPATMAAGFEAYLNLLETARYDRDRRDAALRLSHSLNTEHRFRAAEALLDVREATEAGKALQWLRPMALLGPEAQARFDYLQGRYLVATGEGSAGRELLRRLASDTAHDPWSVRSHAVLVRHLLSSRQPDAGVLELDKLVQRCTRSVPGQVGPAEAGDVLWWWARRLQSQGKSEAAAGQYLRLAKAYPSHDRAGSALFSAAAILADAGKVDKALDVYETLAERHPSSRYFAEAMFRTGRLLESSGKSKKAARAYARAAHAPLGDFYAHRALDRLAALGKDEGLAGPKLQINGNPGLLRPRVLKSHGQSELPQGWKDTDWYERLCLFARHGLVETDWEALEVLEQHGEAGDPGDLLVALREAGANASAIEFARALAWGDKDGAPTPERLLVEFPLAYWPDVQAMAKETGLDPLLILAVARQESLFQARVVSSAGATGVMQLMPGTAQWLVRAEPAVKQEHAENLTHPANSLRLGAYYLMRMVERSDGNLVFAAASYNGGPGNLDKWRRANPTRDMDAFIDGIPFSETRGFVKKVLGNYAAYHSLYGEGAGGDSGSVVKN